MISRSNLRRTFIVSIAIVTALAFMPFFGAGQAQAAKAKTKGRLVKSVKVEELQDGKWVKTKKTTYTYNKKKDPKTITKYEYYPDGSISNKNTETYYFKYRKSGKRLSCKMKMAGDIPGTKREWNYDKNGRLTRYEFHDDESTNIATTKYTKTGYLKSFHFYDSFIDAGSDDYTGKCVPVTKSGLLTKMTFYRMASDWKTELSMTFLKKPTSKKGLISSLKVANTKRAKSFKYKVKNGRVTSVTVSITNNAGEKSKERYTFSYTKKQAGKVRYASMINSIIDDHHEGYAFRWY